MKLLTMSKILALGLLAPSFVFAQATSTLNLALEGKMISPIGNDDAKINVLGEMLKQYPNLKTSTNLEVSMVKIDSYAGVGGAQIFLRVNNNVVDGVVVENPEYKTFELKNIERSQMTEASLILQNVSKIKVRNIQVVLGSPEEPAIFGHYADQQVSQIGGGTIADHADYNESATATPEQVAAVMEKYYGETVAAIQGSVVNPNQVVVQPTVQQPVPGQRPSVATGGSALNSCILTTRGPLACVGAVVYDNYEGQGIITQVNLSRSGNHQVNVNFNNGRNAFTMLQQVRVIENGSYAFSGAKSAENCYLNARNQNICLGQSVLNQYSNEVLSILDFHVSRSTGIAQVRNNYGQVKFTSLDELTATQQNSGYGQATNNGANQNGYGNQQPAYNGPRECVSDKKSRQQICTGDRVAVIHNRVPQIGSVVGVKDKRMGKDTVDVRLESTGRTVTYKVDEVTKR